MFSGKPASTVERGAKEDLVLKKQIRQSTTKILQRPSYFQDSQRRVSQDNQVSPEVLNALLHQRKDGKLSNSVLENWVHRFEKEFDDHQTNSASKISEDYIEAQFQALHAELTSDYASRKLDSCVPPSQILDSSHAKDKLKLRKGKQQQTKQEQIEANANSFVSPKLGNRQQASNVTRNQLTKPTQDSNKGFSLGREPNVYHRAEPSKTTSSIARSFGNQVAKSSDANGEMKNTSLASQLVQRFTDSLERRKKVDPKAAKSPTTPTSKTEQESSVEATEKENLYEEIPTYSQVLKTPRKKAKPRAPNPDDYEDISVQSLLTKEPCESPTEADHRPVPVPDPVPVTVPVPATAAALDEDTGAVPRKRKVLGPAKAPFERFQNCLFSTFTACAPWCLMRKVYWKKEKYSEELFAVTSRRNSRIRAKTRASFHQL